MESAEGGEHKSFGRIIPFRGFESQYREEGTFQGFWLSKIVRIK
jgi:hypothetical protein